VRKKKDMNEFSPKKKEKGKREEVQKTTLSCPHHRKIENQKKKKTKAGLVKKAAGKVHGIQRKKGYIFGLVNEGIKRRGDTR